MKLNTITTAEKMNSVKASCDEAPFGEKKLRQQSTTMPLRLQM
ncbi:hypothetical protein AAFO92_09805 [Roseovarius sp. CAU 1744]